MQKKQLLQPDNPVQFNVSKIDHSHKYANALED